MILGLKLHFADNNVKLYFMTMKENVNNDFLEWDELKVKSIFISIIQYKRRTNFLVIFWISARHKEIKSTCTYSHLIISTTLLYQSLRFDWYYHSRQVSQSCHNYGLSVPFRKFHRKTTAVKPLYNEHTCAKNLWKMIILDATYSNTRNLI